VRVAPRLPVTHPPRLFTPLLQVDPIDMPAYPVLAPTPRRSPPSTQAPQPSFALSDADLDRFATLFSPATPPATPTLVATESPPAARPRKSTDSDFGAFVSVPPSQDPLSHDAASVSQPHVSPTGNHSLVYFDRFTATAKTAAERNKREVLDELLHHQDDPMYFLDTHPVLSSTSTACSAVPIPIPTPMPTSTDDALAEALASEMTHPMRIRVERRGSVKVAPSPSRALPPRLSGSASPPSISSPTSSTTSLPTSSPPRAPSSMSASAHPAHATLSRISSSLVSLLPSGRPPRSTASSAPGTTSRFHSPFASTGVTHGSPFASAPYIPPTGAPGFAGDRAWDRGFSEVLAQEETRGLVDPVGLGIGGETEMTAHARRVKGRGVTLVGRREGTVRVLTEEMADLVRVPCPRGRSC
jgi:hypothetical protein